MPVDGRLTKRPSAWLIIAIYEEDRQPRLNANEFTESRKMLMLK